MTDCRLPTAVDPKDLRSLAGARAQGEGAAFEQLLETIHAQYLAQGRAAIYKNATASRYVGGGNIITEQSRPDFSGTLKGGVSIHFDSKSMSDVCGWRLSKKQMHQYQDLLNQSAMGAIAFFLVENRIQKAVYFLRVHPSIPCADGQPEIKFSLSIPVFDGRRKLDANIPLFCMQADAGGVYDWLTAVESVWLGRRELVNADGEWRPLKRGDDKKIRVGRDAEICRKFLEGKKTGRRNQALIDDLAQKYSLQSGYLRMILKSGGVRMKREQNPVWRGHAATGITGVHRGKLRRKVQIRGDEIVKVGPGEEEAE